MKNYLIYARTSASNKTLDNLSLCKQTEMMKVYAEFHKWNVVGHVIDETGFENLRSYLRKYKDISTVVFPNPQNLTFDDYAAMKAILDKESVSLVIIGIQGEAGNDASKTSLRT